MRSLAISLVKSVIWHPQLEASTFGLIAAANNQSYRVRAALFAAHPQNVSE